MNVYMYIAAFSILCLLFIEYYVESDMKDSSKLSLAYIKFIHLILKYLFAHIFAKIIKIIILAVPRYARLLILINFNFDKYIRIILE